MSAKVQISPAPDLKQPLPRTEEVINHFVDGYTYNHLIDAHGHDAAKEKMSEMVEAFLPGLSNTILFIEDGIEGMSLSHIWFGPNFPLFRHSHPAYGNCLYYVVEGEIHMGQKTLRKGSTIFMPATHPYKYSAGPAGVEVLEFRAGGGDPEGPTTQIHEKSFESIDEIIEGCRANEASWVAPKHIGETAER